MSAELRWPSKAAALALHDRSKGLHGGAPGPREEGVLESVLARPANRFRYEAIDDVCALAATYLVALASNNAFTDGNKRVAFAVMGLFLRLNGRRLIAAQADAVRTVLAVAAGERDIDALAEWVRTRSIEV
ncbi:type II toxin-antitoxin system death-on-curing family toxin [Phenylobacterium sp.]|uniref:type II toxin-antitoxin system death-on-curing family toxin n=1 Tax=Phenylobacterium sp. TaxID=1871053 RepID=UPI00286A59BD|nr:type II toxin-antitoxin system death-on-curing family toxin [Phenylobacterium sp.]